MSCDKPSLSVDVGGTRTKLIVLEPRTNEIVRRGVADTPAAGGDDVLAMIASVIAEVGVPPNSPVGVAPPGAVDPHTGEVGLGPNLPGITSRDVRPSLA